MKPKAIVILVFLALMAVILIQNTQMVVYRLFFWNVSVSQLILIPLVLALGFVFGYLLARSRKRR